MVRETIEIVTVMRDLATGTVKKINAGIEDLGNGVRQTTKVLRTYNKNILTGTQYTKTFTRGLKSFEFEWLSILFLGMQIARTFGYYVKGALEMTGITDYLTETLKIMVFTALEPFLGEMFDVISAFNDLPAPIQAAVGWFFILATVLGTLAFYIAMVRLGFQGVSLIGIASFLSLLSVVALVVAGIGIFIVGLVRGIKERFGEMGGRIEALGIMLMGFGILVAMVFGPLGLVVTLIGAAVFLIGKYWDQVKAWTIEKWTAIKDFFKNILGMIIGFFTDTLPTFLQWGKDFVMKIINGILSTGEGIINAILSLFPSWMRESIKNTGTATIKIFHTVIETVRRVFRQRGGAVASGMPYIVGEVGPELFVPRTAGRIIPHGMFGAGGGATIVFSPVYNINVTDRRELESLIKSNNIRMVEDLRRLIET